MDNYDQDLIFDLAAGVLPEEEARAAEAALTPEGRAELEAQRSVLAAISSEPSVQMTDIERARLHRAVTAGIAEATRELPAVAAVSAPPRPSRSVLWMRVASAAGAAALLVGVVAVGSQLTGTDGDASADAPLLTATSVAAEAGSDPQRSTTTAPASLAGDAESDMSGGALDEPGMPTTESLAMLREAPALTGPPEQSDLGALADFATGMITTQRNTTSSLSLLPCYDVATEDDDLAVADSFLVPYSDEDGEERLAIAYSDGGTSETKPLVLLYDPSTCERLGDETAP